MSKNLIFNKFLIILLLSGALRLVTILFTSQSLYEHNDSFLHRDWGRVMFLFGPAATYDREYISDVGNVNNLPPGATYLFGSMYYLHIQFSKVINLILQRDPGMVLWMNDGTLANIFLRLPSAIADIIIGILIYKIVSIFNKKRAFLSSILYLFNPAIIYIGSFWGQVDSITLMLFLVGLYSYYDNKLFLSILFVALSAYFKLSLLPLFPIYFLLLIKKYKFKNILLNSLSVSAILIITILPFSSNPIMWLVQFSIKNSSNVLDNITANAYNFWWLILAPKLSVPTFTVDENFIFLSYGQWGYVLFFIFIAPLVYAILSVKSIKKIPYQVIMGIFSATCILYFLFLPSMHERYIISLFPFLAILSGFKKIYVKIYLILMIIFAINVFSVWQYGVPEVVIRSNPLLTNVYFSWVMSLAFVGTGLYFYVNFLQYFFKKYSKN